MWEDKGMRRCGEDRKRRGEGERKRRVRGERVESKGKEGEGFEENR